MAPLPPDNTSRAYVDYSDGVNAHTWVVRYMPPNGHADALAQMDLLLQALSEDIYALSILGARYSVAGSNITFPAEWAGASVYGEGVMPTVNAPREFTIGGKSITGRLTSLSFYGINMATPTDYMYDAADWGVWGSIQVALNAFSETGVFVGIDGERVLWRDRVTVGFNDHWVKEARGI